MFFGYYYGFDMSYIVLVLPCVILSLWASFNVNNTFKKYSNQLSARRITGAQAAQRVLSAHGIHNVRIERIPGNLSDHYDPKANVIRLSDSVYDNTSTAAIGVAISTISAFVRMFISGNTSISRNMNSKGNTMSFAAERM